MDFQSFWNDKRYRYGIIGLAVLICTLLAFWIRIIPMAVLAGTGNMIAGPDAWYNLRLVEVALANNFGYIFFEPMTLYPTGQEIVWGPLFTYIASFFALIAGAATRVDIITAVSWTPAVLGALMVPVMFFLGKRIGDWKTGFISALFIAVIGGQFLSRSLYGHFDHHIAETLFSSLFCLCYVLTLYALSDHKIDLKQFSTLKLPLLYGVICGIAYFLGLLTMTTMVVFGMFVAVFTLIQFILNQYSGKPTEYLLSLNVVTFIIAALGLLLYGIRNFSFGFTDYSLGLFLVHLLLVLGTVVLYLISRLVTKFEKPWYYYLITLVILLATGSLILALALPDLFNSLIGNLAGFFANNATAATVQEMSSWSFTSAVSSYNWGILLAIGGFICLLWNIWKHQTPGVLFVVIWSFFMFFATCAHIRWEYYFAANVALLAAVFVGWAITFAEKDLGLLIAKRTESQKPTEPANKKQAKKSKTQEKSASGKPDPIKLGIFVVIMIIAVVFVGSSSAYAVELSSASANGGTTQDWIDACEWLSVNTPDTGVDYLTIYDESTFTYPPESYGVLSWWDYGHYITTIGKRIPNSNPFQAGVSGEYGVAAVLTNTDEAQIMEKLDHLGTKYVMTDYLMANGIFGAMAIWNDTTLQTTPYYYTFLQQGSDGTYSYVSAPTPEFYNTLTVRLQNFDGSMTDAGSVYVVITDSTAGYGAPVITSTKVYTDVDEAWTAAENYNANATSGKYAYVISAPTDLTNYNLPSVKVPALQHFRLTYESTTYVVGGYVTGANEGGTAYVKTFEYVPGAVIKGEGIIEVDVITNNGRTFTYRQESVDGQFIVPYVTSGSSSDVKTTGLYTIVGTGQTFAVSEQAVQNGLTIN
ncbi:MAG: oligosaccharyl transferase, archaeosortase A system-associated [Methanocorpusculum sp.]|uniref:oligosaccharyl transferase, archaeosortase A system-associated n=1 Tax=Methanocorpusculum sp. TaxID=2058474 RepID=UPI0027257FBB|nr:oligosaccharyl transferase, archaeosortase A system-associated [Methanocorpusculum sp.]MDO9523669.1 oligosaccharyl transferase, archaeosortase A system-associated [Methanocorpusculum sp.]